MTSSNAITTVCFTFAEEDEHELLKRYKVIGDRADIILTPRDKITGIDLSFCRCLNVWIDAKPIDYRRARYLWKELLLAENRPAAIYVSTEQGLTVFKPYENKRINFERKQDVNR